MLQFRKSLFTSVTSLTLVIMGGLSLSFSQQTSAVTGSEWQAGNIISDSIFTDNTSMSVADIQTFLNARMPNCDTNGTQKINSSSTLTRAQYSISKGLPAPPYVCVRNYHENPTTHETNFSGSIPAGAISAAQIIKNTADTYKINPKALLVLIQKESSLLTNSWPFLSQYRAATGYACPDTAACDSTYYGFYNQVTAAAKQLRRYINYPANYRYKPYQNNTILWSPNSACGSSTVYIKTAATAALYNYTPYQPNTAALNNLYGTGDSCSAYGNRNFWRIFSDWFGSTNSPPKSNLYIQNGDYLIINTNSNNVVKSTNSDTGSSISLAPQESMGITWKIRMDNEGYYSFQDIASSKYLDVVNASTVRGAKLQLWGNDLLCSQQWAAVSYGSNIIFLSKCSGLALDVTGGIMTEGTDIQLWDRNNTAAQLWSLKALSPAQIVDGDYLISSSGGLALDVINGGLSSGTGVQIYEQNGSLAQKWAFARQNDGSYTIQNPISNKYLSVSSSSTVAGENIKILDGDIYCGQRWYVSVVNNTAALSSACSGMALDVRGGLVNQSGTKVQIWDSNGTPAQQWKITAWVDDTSLKSGSYSIKTTAGKALDVKDGFTQSGTKVQIWDSNGTPAQQWKITKLSDGSYIINNPNSGKNIDVTNGDITSGTSMQIWNSNNTCAQRWKINKIDASSLYSIKSACTEGIALDVKGAAINTNGTPVQIYIQNDTPAQKWAVMAL